MSNRMPTVDRSRFIDGTLAPCAAQVPARSGACSIEQGEGEN
jgi:hypothetical protein